MDADINSLLFGNSEHVAHPVWIGEIHYSDGSENYDLLRPFRGLAPKQIVDADGVVRKNPITNAQAIVMIRAFRNANSAEGMCLYSKILQSQFLLLRKAYEAGIQTLTGEESKVFKRSWPWLEQLFRTCQIVQDLAKVEMLAVIHHEATKGRITRKKKTTTYTSPENKITTVYSEEEVQEPPDPKYAQYFLGVYDPGKYRETKNFNINGTITGDVNALDEVLQAINRINPLPETPALEAEFKEEDETVDSSDRTD